MRVVFLEVVLDPRSADSEAYNSEFALRNKARLIGTSYQLRLGVVQPRPCVYLYEGNNFDGEWERELRVAGSYDAAPVGGAFPEDELSSLKVVLFWEAGALHSWHQGF